MAKVVKRFVNQNLFKIFCTKPLYKHQIKPCLFLCTTFVHFTKNLENMERIGELESPTSTLATSRVVHHILAVNQRT